MATITVTCGTGISGVAWRQYNSSGAQIDSGTFGGTKSWTASSGYLMIYPNRESGYNHPIYYTRTDGYVQTITNSDGSDNDRKISFTQNKTGTVTATYHAPSTYIISYDANGGAGAPSAQTKTHGVNLTLSSTKPSRTGYDFLYWQDQGTDYSIWHPGDSFDRDRNTTLKAIWQRKTYTVSYNANGGTGAPAAQTKYYGENLILTTDEPTRAGYNFINWFDGTEYYSPGGVYTANSPATLYAQWNRKKYTITFNANGGSGAPSPQIKEHDITLTLSSVKPTRTGYDFVNWFDGTDYYNAGGPYTPNSPATLYAQWRLKTYTVHFDANGGTGAPADQTKTHGVTLTLSSTIPTRTNYTFKNWFDGTDYYEAGGPYTPNSPATLLAQWEHITCALFYWHGSDAADAAKFAARQPVQDALTAAAWNSMITKVNELRGLLGQSTIQIPAVSAGERIGAVAFNRLRYIISDTTGAGTLPATVSEGDRITTGLFNGPGSLKAALNTAIEAFNNS